MNDWSTGREGVRDLIRREGVVAAGNARNVAGILYTYRCTIACRHCCFGSSGARPDVRMTTEQVVGHLRSLHELGRVVHVAGGEAMMYWDDLREALSAAAREGLQPHFIETNASFAVSDETAVKRVEELLDLGVVGLLISADPYHQAHVPPENFIRLRRIAKDRMGPTNVWCPDDPDERIREYTAIIGDPDRLGEYVRAHPPTMVGTAQRTLRQYLAPLPVEQLGFDVGWRRRHVGWNCAVEFDAETMWEVHVDPYDNIQTNCGVILGNAARVSVADVLAAGPARANPIATMLAEQGPLALARYAEGEHGYRLPETACTKCDLCQATRRFLRPFHPDILGPAEVYE